MAHSIPTSEPFELDAGSTWTWRRDDLSDYPPSAWTLSYYFKNPSAAFTVTATEDGGGFLVNVPPAVTANNAAGRYDWRAYVTDGPETHPVDAGVLEVKPNWQTVEPYDGRSLPRLLLDAVNAILKSRATNDQIDMVNAAAGDQNVSRNPTMLLEMRSKLEQEVKRVEGTGGLKNVNVRFVDVAI